MALTYNYECGCGECFTFYITKQRAYGRGDFIPAYVSFPEDIPKGVDWRHIDMEEEGRGEVDLVREAAEQMGRSFIDTRRRDVVRCRCGRTIAPFQEIRRSGPGDSPYIEEFKILFDDEVPDRTHM